VGVSSFVVGFFCKVTRSHFPALHDVIFRKSNSGTGVDHMRRYSNGYAGMNAQ
jgi:hypothetical protein